jgi:hypothetical protein
VHAEIPSSIKFLHHPVVFLEFETGRLFPDPALASLLQQPTQFFGIRFWWHFEMMRYDVQ